MTHWIRNLSLLGLLVALAAYAWYATRPERLTVRLATVERGVVESRVANTRSGTIKACRRARLAPAVGGQIAELAVSEGLRVAKGDLLLALWSDDLEARVRLAEAEVEAGQAAQVAACLRTDHARREADRLGKLRARGVASEEAVDQARTEAWALKADCDAAHATIRVKQAQLGVAVAKLAQTRLTAPFAGVVAEVTGELHEYVTPSPPGIPTPPAVDLIDDRCFYVSAPIDEVDAPAVLVGQQARVGLDAFGEQQLPGRVRRIAPYVLDFEKQARTVEVEVELVSGVQAGAQAVSHPALLAGYSADVEIITDHRDAVPRVPTEAVMEGGRVYRYVDAGTGSSATLAIVAIEPGLSNWEWTEVLSGLQPGDRVVTSLAREGLADGVAVVSEDGDDGQAAP